MMIGLLHFEVLVPLSSDNEVFGLFLLDISGSSLLGLWPALALFVSRLF